MEQARNDVTPRILIVAHIYYPDLWPELLECIRNIGEADLIVTYVNEESAAEAKADRPDAKFICCENRGFDIWPFLKALQTVRLEDYDYVVKLHTKRNVYSDRPIRPFLGLEVSGSKWRDALLAFCRSPKNWRRSLACLNNPKVGMVSSVNLILGRNSVSAYESLYDLACERLHLPMPVEGRYVGGTMFVVRSDCLKSLNVGAYTAKDFEQTVRDGCPVFAHVFERMLGLCVYGSGYRIVGYDGTPGGYLKLYLRIIAMELLRFVYQNKRTMRGKHLIKVCRIPVWNAKPSPTRLNALVYGLKWLFLDRKHHETFVSLGYNCELAYRYYRRNGFVDSGLFQWSAARSLDDLVYAVGHLDQLFTGEVRGPDALYECVNTHIKEHGREPQRTWAHGVTDENRGLMERDREELISRISYLKEKFVRTLRAGNALVAYKLRSDEAWAFGTGQKLRQLQRLLEELAGDAAPSNTILLVMERSCTGCVFPSWKGPVRFVGHFNPNACVTDMKLGDRYGWKLIFDEFVPRHRKEKRHNYKFEMA